MNIMQRINQEMSTVVDRVGRSLVQIQNGHRGVGAGTIWHPAGLILTNAHVVARHSRRSPHHLRIILHDGRAFQATVLAEDPQRDLAALCIDADDDRTGECAGAPAGRLAHGYGPSLGRIWRNHGRQRDRPGAVAGNSVGGRRLATG